MQRSLISLIIGVVLAGAGIALLNIYFDSSKTPPAAAVALRPVVVAAADLPYGTPLRPELLKVIAWPQDSAPDGSFASIDEVFKGQGQPADRVVLRETDRNEPILRSKISGFGGKATLSREVSNGMRAVSISVNDVSGVSGFMLPGDHVDVVLTRRLPADAGTGSDSLVSDIILQNITILGIDQVSDQQRDQPVVARTATVEVTPEQAQKLALAQQAGTLSLALRNVETVNEVPTARVNLTDLGNATTAPLLPHHENDNSVRVHYGDGTVVTQAVH